jgi:predicted nuclease of predicted toxin-antitoxin system
VKLKLDENLGERGRRALTAAGHEVCTVAIQNLQSASDRELLAQCIADGRALVTFDLDFANPVIYPPAKHTGVAVLRLPPRATPTHVDLVIATFVEALKRQSLAGNLWIVETARVRIYDSES